MKFVLTGHSVDRWWIDEFDVRFQIALVVAAGNLAGDSLMTGCCRWEFGLGCPEASNVNQAWTMESVKFRPGLWNLL